MVYVDGTLTVGQATLTVTAANASRAYGAANPVFSATATGAQGSDSFTLTASSAATSSSPVGTYPIVPLATGANLSNYTVVYVDGTLTVGQATLTVTAANASRAYGAANPVFSATATGAQSGDTFTLTASSAATTSSPGGDLPDRSSGDGRKPRELHRGLRRRNPDRRPGHPDGDGSERRPRLRCRQPGLHRDARRARRAVTPSP